MRRVKIRLVLVVMVVCILTPMGQMGEASPARQTGTPTLVLTHPARIKGANWSPDGRWIASWGSGYVYVWDVVSGVRVASMSQDTAAEPLWSPDSRWLATWEQDMLSIWSIESLFSEGATLPFNGIATVIWSPDSSRIAVEAGFGVVPISRLNDASTDTPDKDRLVHIWNISSMSNEYLLNIPPVMLPVEFTWNSDGNYFAVWGLGDVSSMVWDMTSGMEIQELRQPYFYSKRSLDLIDGRMLLTGMQGGVAMFDIASRTELYRVYDDGYVRQVFISPDRGRFAALLEANRRLPIFDVDTGTLVQTLRSDYFFLSAEWSRDNQLLLTGLADGNGGGVIMVWQVETGVAQMIIPFTGTLDRADWSADTTWISALLVTGFLDSAEIVVWNASTGMEGLRLPVSGNIVSSLTWIESSVTWHPIENRLWRVVNADGSCTANCTYEVQVWDVQ